MAPVIVMAALAGALPTMDLHSICRGEQLGVPADRQTRVYQDCLRDEQAARDQLTQKWAQFPAAARGACAELGQLVFSYVEVLVCIEIKIGNISGDARTISPQASPPP
jgi:hypothetical protein